MKHFPMSLSLEGQVIYLIGDGPQIRDKAEKLAPFGGILLRKQKLSALDAKKRPAMVVVGDLPEAEAGRIAALCRRKGIPVNVVDRPALCSFYFPALISRGDMTVSVATGGSCPEGAACLRQLLEQALPERTEELLAWLSQNRQQLRQQGIMTQAAAAAFREGRPLTGEELSRLHRD